MADRDNSALAQSPRTVAMERCVAAIQTPARKRDFYKAWLALAFWHSWGSQDFVAGVLGLLFPLIAKAIPAWESAMSALAWQIPLAVLGTIFLTRLLLAPYWLYQERDRQAAHSEAKLLELKSQAKLFGSIKCLNWEIALNVSATDDPFTEDVTNHGHLTMEINLWNDSEIATTITDVTLVLLWEGGSYVAERVSLKGYYLELSERTPSAWESKLETRLEPIRPFPFGVEITNTRNQAGFVRFFCVMPLEAANVDFRDSVTLRLSALDKREHPHLIYEGTFRGFQRCPPLVRREMKIY